MNFRSISKPHTTNCRCPRDAKGVPSCHYGLAPTKHRILVVTRRRGSPCAGCVYVGVSTACPASLKPNYKGYFLKCTIASCYNYHKDNTAWVQHANS